MILHIVNKSPFADNSLTDCLRFASAGDSILLIEDGVLAAKQYCAFEDLLNKHPAQCFALAADLEARGLVNDCASHINSCSDQQFVDLTVQHPNIQSWY